MALLGCAFTAQAQQLPNVGFENWKESAGYSYQSSRSGMNGSAAGLRQRPGDEPMNWNGSSVNQTVMSMNKQETLVEKGISRNGTASLVLTNKFVGLFNFGDEAPAFVTFATPWVYAVSKIAECDGGSYGGVTFTHRPDSIKGWYKRTKGDADENAHIIAYVWKGTFTSAIKSHTSNDIKEDVDRVVLGKEDAILSGTLIASCDYAFAATINNDWQEISVALDYVEGQENAIPEKMNVIISSADYWTRTNIQKNSKLEVDDVKYVYNSQLSSLSYNGSLVYGFDKDVYTYTIEGEYTDGCLEAVKNCVGGSCTIGAFDEATGTVTITVKGDDWSEENKNEHSYVVTFNSATVQPEVTEFTNPLTVSINGATTAPQTTTIQLIKEVDGSYSFALNNFMLISGESVIPVGNIKLTNLDVDGDTYTANQAIVIENGTLDDVDFWLGPSLGEVPVVLTAVRDGDNMTADIDIDMTNVLGQSIKVVFAPEVTLSDGEAPAFTGLKNVTLIRTFTTGWNTICLPFDYSVNAFGDGAKAQAFASAKAAGLSFEKVEEMQANVPYLLYVPQNITEPIYFGKQVVAAVPLPVTQGDFTFVGTYESMSMADKYGVANVDGADRIRLGGASATIKGTRAYFTTTATGIKEMALLLDGTATAISRTEAATEAGFDVYTLTGIQVRKGAASLDGLKAGIYIVNGKKMIIK